MIPLPYDNCELNNEYLIMKIKESSITSNMIFCFALVMLYILFTGLSTTESQYISMVSRYTTLIKKINNDYKLFDLNVHNIKDPQSLIDFYDTLEFDEESKSDSDSDQESDSDSDQECNKPSRFLRSHNKQSPILYAFDREYTNSNSNSLDISGKNWKLD